MCLFSSFIFKSDITCAVPILTFPGTVLCGATVQEAVTKADVQYKAAKALYERYENKVWLSGMDLSVEAEEFGCEIRYSEDETPSVIGRLIEDLQGVETLALPALGSGRSEVYLESLSRMSADPSCSTALGGMIGPFSLAGRLFGLSELMMALIMEPDLVRQLLEKITVYLVSYAKAQKNTGAAGTIIAEPSAGLVSPDSLRMFSTPYVKQIIQAVQDDSFEVILHNCAAKTDHLDAIYEAGAKGYHFGATTDMESALEKAPENIIIAGNLDPAHIFCSNDIQNMKTAVTTLMKTASSHKNFVLSSGCDIPAAAPFSSIDAFFAAWKTCIS